MTESQDKNLNILRSKGAFKIKEKAFFIIFEYLTLKQIIKVILLPKHWQYAFYLHAYIIKNSWCNEVKEIKSDLPNLIIWSLVLLAILYVYQPALVQYMFELVLK